MFEAFLSGVKRCLTGRPFTVEEEDRLECFARIATSEDGKAFIRWLESLHGEDYLVMRASEGEAAARVKGQAARTDQVLSELRGASRKLATQRRKRYGKR